MVVSESLRFEDVLVRWARRECDCGNFPGQAPPSDEGEWLDLLDRHAPRLVAEIRAAGPIGALRIAFEPRDVDNLVLYNGEPVGSRGDARLIQELVATPDRTPIVCTALVERSNSDKLIGPFSVYDGWHRSAAWRIRISHGHSELLEADVIKVLTRV